MPGVPSGRACDGCRKQKKKCDSVTSPCTRCQRLQITCVGFGQRRYVFKHEGQKLAHLDSSSAIPFNDTIFNLPKALMAAGPSHTLSNDLTRLTSVFVHKIDPSVDIKIQLPWNFGGFLADVPCRLGINESLDAAADALGTAYTGFCAGNVIPHPEALVKYSRALNALRRCLSDPVKACSSETLCSVMLLLIIQVFMGMNEKPWIGHSAGAAQILKSRGYFGPQDEFESKLLLSLRGAVIAEALLDDKICLTQQEWKDLVLNGFDNGTIDEEMIKCSARIPNLMQRGRKALKCPRLEPNTLQEVKHEVYVLHGDFQPILSSLRARLNGIESVTISLSAEVTNMVHAHYTRTFGLGLAVGIIINSIFCALEDDNHHLRQETLRMSEEILKLADTVSRYRPLGALYMKLCLSVACIDVSEEHTRTRAMNSLMDYQRDLLGPTSNVSSEQINWAIKHFTLK